MPKAIAYPTDSRLLEKSRQHLVRLADEHHLELRQNYNRQAPRMAAQIGHNIRLMLKMGIPVDRDRSFRRIVTGDSGLS